MMREFANVVVRDQEGTKNIVQNPVFDLTSTKTGPRPDKPVANAADNKQRPQPIGDHTELTANSANKSVKRDPPLRWPTPTCRLGCVDKVTKERLRHLPENCYHRTMSDDARAAAKATREQDIKTRQLEKQVKQVAGSDAGKQAAGKKITSATAEVPHANKNSPADYRTFFYDDDNEIDREIISSSDLFEQQRTINHASSSRTAALKKSLGLSVPPTIAMTNGTVSATHFRGVKHAQYDNGANVSIIDSARDLIDVQDIESINIDGWAGPGRSHTVSQQGFLPGFGIIFLKPGASCIFSEYQFLVSGWTKSTDHGIDPNSQVSMEMYTYLTKAGVTICFMREANNLWYAPYNEIITKIQLAHRRFEQTILEANPAVTRRMTAQIPSPIQPTHALPTQVLSDVSNSQVDSNPTNPDVHDSHVDSEPSQPIQQQPEQPASATQPNNTPPLAETVAEAVNNELPPAQPPPVPIRHPLEATISPSNPNYDLLKSRLNHRGGNRPYTDREIEHIKLCQLLHLNGHYSPRKMKQLIVHTPNCPLTVADIDNWTHLYWPCASCLEGE